MPGFVLGVRLVLAAVFAVAGTAKLLDAAGSRAALEGFGVPRAAARPASRVLPVAELAIAAGLLVPASAWWSALAAAGLLAVFMAAIGVEHGARGRPRLSLLRAAPLGAGELAHPAEKWRARRGRRCRGAGRTRRLGPEPGPLGRPAERRGARARRRRRGAVRGGGGARLVPVRACPGRTAGSWPAWRIWSSGSAPAARLGPRGWRVCGRPAVRAPSGVLPSVCRPRTSSCLPPTGGASRCGRFSAGDCRCCSSSQFPGAVTATHCSRRWPAGSTSIATASRLRSQPGDLPGRTPPRRRHPGCAMCSCKPTAKSPRPTRQTAPRAQC